jgi:hypothetical protein
MILLSEMVPYKVVFFATIYSLRNYIQYVAWFIDFTVSRWFILYKHLAGAWQSIFVVASKSRFSVGKWTRVILYYE